MKQQTSWADVMHWKKPRVTLNFTRETSLNAGTLVIDQKTKLLVVEFYACTDDSTQPHAYGYFNGVIHVTKGVSYTYRGQVEFMRNLAFIFEAKFRKMMMLGRDPWRKNRKTQNGKKWNNVSFSLDRASGMVSND